jgi:hypothetical protein
MTEERKAPCARHCEATAFEIEIRQLKRQLAECQAERNKLFGELEFECGGPLNYKFDSNALDTLKKQWQREALLEAADWFEPLDIGDCWPEDELRRMAKELE